MIPLVLLTLSAALPTVESGWQPLDGGGVMYIVRLSADDVTGLRTQMLTHTVPPEVRDIRRIMLHSRQGRLPRQLPTDPPAAAAPTAANAQRWLVPLELEQQWLPYLQQDGLVFDVPADSTDVGSITITLMQPAPLATPPAGQAPAGETTAEPAFPGPPVGETTQTPPTDNPFAGRPDPAPFGPVGETTEGLVPVARPGEVSGGTTPAPGESFSRPSWMDREGPSIGGPAFSESERPVERRGPVGERSYGRRSRDRAPATSDNWPSDFPTRDRAEPPAASPAVAEAPAAAAPAATEASATPRSPSDQVIPAQNVASDEASRPWLPLTAAVLILLVSLAANVYLGWVSWESRERYRHLLTQVHNPG